MDSIFEIQQKVQIFHELGQTIEAGLYILDQYEIKSEYFKGFELREKATASMILFTAEGEFGEPQIIKMPENAFEFDLTLIVNLIAHEMVHVIQKNREPYLKERSEREIEAYSEMLYHSKFPLVPKLPKHQEKFMANAILSYYKKIEENIEHQKKYANFMVNLKSEFEL